MLNTAGYVTNLWHDGKSLYTRMRIGDRRVREKLHNGLVPGFSLMLNLNYKDRSTGRKVGPAVLHQALCARPWIVGLRDFTPVKLADGTLIDVIALSRADYAHRIAAKNDYEAKLETQEECRGIARLPRPPERRRRRGR